MDHTCPRCKNSYHPHIVECPTCKLINFNVATWIPDQVKQDYVKKWQEKKSDNITKKFIEKSFERILKKYGKKLKKLKVKTGMIPTEISVKDNFQTNVEVSFNPSVLSFYDDDEIDATLHYLAFLLFTMQGSSNIRAPNVGPNLVNYLTDFTVLYNAYLAYSKYSTYFNQNEAYLRAREREIPNFSIIIYGIRNALLSSEMPPLFSLLGLSTIFQDALYFTLFYREKLESWAREYNMNSILTLYNWIIDDFKIIHDSKSSLNQMFDRTQLIGKLTTTVDTNAMMLKDRIIFLPDSKPTLEKLLSNTKDMTEGNLIKLWLTRVAKFSYDSDEYNTPLPNKIENLKNYLKKFDPDTILNFVTLTSGLPGNEIFGNRLELLFKIILTIPETEFKYEKLDDDSIDHVLLKIGEMQYWKRLENYHVTSTIDYPPIWILGKKYAMMAGIQMRAYENWKDIVAEYYPLKEQFHVKFNYEPITVIEDSLELQTHLFNFVIKSIEKCRKSSDLLIPPLMMVLEWKKIIDEWRTHSKYTAFFNSNVIQMGLNIETEKLITIEDRETFFKFHAVKMNSSLVVIPQHFIHEFLKYKFNLDVRSVKSEFSEEIWRNTHSRLYHKLLYLFSPRYIIPDFSISSSEKVDFGIIFDVNKLFLIKIIDTDFITKDIQEEISDATKSIESIERNLVKNAKMLSGGKEIGAVPDIQLEIIPILLVKTNFLSLGIYLPKENYIVNKTNWFCYFTDFISLAGDIKDGLRFLLFLRRLNQLKTESKVDALTELDLYAYYVDHNDSFLQSGIHISHFRASRDLWDAYLIKKLKKEVDFQARFSDDEPDDFWELAPIDNNIFDARNIFHGWLSRVFRLEDGRIIWFMITNGEYKFSPPDTRTLHLLAELIPYRITKNNSFQNFLTQLGIEKNQVIRFTAFSDIVIKNNDLTQFYDVLKSLTISVPIVINGIKSPSGSIIFPIIYSLEGITELFTSDVLLAEKSIIQVILNAIANQFKPGSDNSKIVQNCMMELFLNSKPAFNLTTMSDPLLLEHSSDSDYTVPLESHLSEIRLEVARFLQRELVSPGSYEGNDAKSIIDKILGFLVAKLDSELSSYNIVQLAPFLIDMQGNTIEARKIASAQTISDRLKVQEFDAFKKYREKSLELSRIADSLRYIAEKAIKISPNGEAILTREKWLYTQALGQTIMESTLVRNVIYSTVGKFRIKITTDYSHDVESVEIDDLIQHSENFDLEMLKRGKTSVHFSDDASLEKFYNDINGAFHDEFNVTFETFTKVLQTCINYPLEKNSHTQVVSEEELIKYIKTKMPELQEDEISNALILASISKDDLQSVDIYSTDMRNRKIRSVVKPIFELIMDGKKKYVLNSWCIRVTNAQWWQYLDEGYLPYDRKYIISDKLKNKLSDFQHDAARSHEKDIELIVRQKTSILDTNVKQNHKCFSGLSGFPGEIDLISFFQSTKQVFLMEAKNIQLNLSPLDIKKEVNKFTESDGFIEKLLKRKKFVEDNLENVLKCYNISDYSGWRVNCLFVTGTFTFNIPNNPIPTIHIDKLSNYLP